MLSDTISAEPTQDCIECSPNLEILISELGLYELSLSLSSLLQAKINKADN